MFKMIFLLFILNIFVLLINGYKIGILVPDISGSQIMFNQRVAETLSDAGHNVTLIRLKIVDFGESKIKTREDIKEIRLEGLIEGYDYDKMQRMQQENGFKDESYWNYFFDKEKKEMLSMISTGMTTGCENIIKQHDKMQYLRDQKFDVVFSHMYDFCPVGIVEIIKPGTWIWLNSGALMDYVALYMGLRLPASYAAPMLADANDKLTFGQRFKSIIGHSLTPIFTSKLTGEPQTQVFRKIFGQNFPNLIDIAKTAPLVFVNSNELYDLPRPTLNKIVNIGGLGMKPKNAKKLPENIQKIVDSAESVVVFTFGSVANASMMPIEWKKAFISSFAQFPKTQFFVRYLSDDLNDIKPKNVHFMKWLPQVDLLHNKKTKILITHGGYNSLQEALYASTPLLAIPLFGDQYRNGRIIEKHNLGLVLMKNEITEDKITKSINELLTNDIYHQSVTKILKMVMKKPVTPEHNLVKWTEFVAEFKTLDNLRPYGAELDLITYYNMDVYAVMITVVVLILFVIFSAVKWILKRICKMLGFCSSCQKNDDKKKNQ